MDLLLVADGDAVEALSADAAGPSLSTLKRSIREGAVILYVMRTKDALLDAGYEELLDSFGLAFLGACR